MSFNTGDWSATVALDAPWTVEVEMGTVPTAVADVAPERTVVTDAMSRWIEVMTQAEYDSLPAKLPTVLYVIVSAT